MYNHARTLLLNLPGTGGYFPEYPGDELIPAEYRQQALPDYLNVFRMRLFGANPDRMLLNYRAAQLLELIAATELQSHVLALDPRLTYGDPDPRLADPATFVPVVTQTSGTTRLTVVGGPNAPDVTGQAAYNYQLTVADGSLQVLRQNFPLVETDTVLEMTNGLSQIVSLPFSTYQVRVNSAAPASWTISGFLRPQLPLSDITDSCKSIGEPYLIQLFGAADVEPYTTFRNCWNNHPEYAYRLGGLVLALIYRTEEIRNGQ